MRPVDRGGKRRSGRTSSFLARRLLPVTDATPAQSSTASGSPDDVSGRAFFICRPSGLLVTRMFLQSTMRTISLPLAGKTSASMRTQKPVSCVGLRDMRTSTLPPVKNRLTGQESRLSHHSSRNSPAGTVIFEGVRTPPPNEDPYWVVSPPPSQLFITSTIISGFLGFPPANVR